MIKPITKQLKTLSEPTEVIFRGNSLGGKKLRKIINQLNEMNKTGDYYHRKIASGVIEKEGLYANHLSLDSALLTIKTTGTPSTTKSHRQTYVLMNYLRQEILQNHEDRKVLQTTSSFAHGGKSTLVVVGEPSTNKQTIPHRAMELYQKQRLIQAYFSTYIPIATDNRLPLRGALTLPMESENHLSNWPKKSLKIYLNQASKKGSVKIALPQLQNSLCLVKVTNGRYLLKRFIVSRIILKTHINSFMLSRWVTTIPELITVASGNAQKIITTSDQARHFIELKRFLAELRVIAAKVVRNILSTNNAEISLSKLNSHGNRLPI